MCKINNYSPYGKDLLGEPMKGAKLNALASRFIIPPFTDLSARSGEWMARKRAWLSMGIKSEIGRGEGLIGGGNRMGYDLLSKIDGSDRESNGTSVFDPVLCELAYRWFTARGDHVVDPFAGGSVRGLVASSMDRKYWGCDMRLEQVTANKDQASDLLDSNFPEYVCGDSMHEVKNAPICDFLFSCPPYGDLERYSDEEGDLSNMDFHSFIAAYKTIILRSVKRLKEDRFACFVVGDFRCNKGFMRDFVSETIRGFENAGAKLYNEAILLTSLGNAGMRATRQFNAARKMIKTHQNVLIFCKGDPKKAADRVTLDDNER